MSPIGSPSTWPLAITDARSSIGQARRSSVSWPKYWMKFMIDAITRSLGSSASPRNSGSAAPKMPCVRSIIRASSSSGTP